MKLIAIIIIGFLLLIIGVFALSIPLYWNKKLDKKEDEILELKAEKLKAIRDNRKTIKQNINKSKIELNEIDQSIDTISFFRSLDSAFKHDFGFYTLRE